jgi:hypothetical protein
MTPSSSIARKLARQSVVPMESTIPGDMTCEQWRRRRVTRPEPAPCDHLQDTATRYDHVEKLLTCLLVCAVCRTERVIHSQHYEPRFQPRALPQAMEASAGATIRQLPVREQPMRRAA